jgi:hypothetical protein
MTAAAKPRDLTSGRRCLVSKALAAATRPAPHACTPRTAHRTDDARWAPHTGAQTRQLRRRKRPRTATGSADPVPALVRRSSPRPLGTSDSGRTGRARRRPGARSARPGPACRALQRRSAKTRGVVRQHLRRAESNPPPAAAASTATDLPHASPSTTMAPRPRRHPARARGIPGCPRPPSPCARTHSDSTLRSGTPNLLPNAIVSVSSARVGNAYVSEP